jgi:hypothetical protein
VLSDIPAVAKAVAAFVSTLAGGIGVVYALTPDVAPTGAEWLGVVVQSAIATAAVYAVPNRPPAGGDDEPKHLAV